MIQTIHLNKTVSINQNQSLSILKDINISVHKGEFIAIMGPSGSGKSTLLNMLSGMDRPSSGSILFNKTNLEDLNSKDLASLRLNKMGFVFQNINFLKNLSILDNIAFPALVAKNSSKSAIYQKANSLLKETSIDQIKNKHINQVSGGELQRGGICRAIINDPDVIFADEPTGALDSTSANIIMSLLKKVHNTGSTIVLVTHDKNIANQADKIIYLYDGKIRACLQE